MPPGTKLPDQWIGLYPAERIETTPGGFRFLVKGTGFFTRYGFARSSQNPPPASSEDRYSALGGDWYLWIWDF